MVLSLVMAFAIVSSLWAIAMMTTLRELPACFIRSARALKAEHILLADNAAI